jgi:hypothetical protein
MTEKLNPSEKAETKPMLGDVPFTDVDGKAIFLGDIIEQTNFNGEQYFKQN